MGLEAAREKVGRNVTHARLKAGFKSVRSLAEHLSFSHTKLGNIEKGIATASPSDLREIASVLKVPVESLQFGSEQRQDMIVKIESMISGENQLEQALESVEWLVNDSLPGFEMAYVKNLQGKVLLQLGKSRKAAISFQTARNELEEHVSEEIDVSHLRFKISANIALTYYSHLEYKTALMHAGEAHDCATNAKEKHDMIQLQALCYAEMEEFDLAQDLYEMVLDEFEKMGDLIGIARTVHSMGDLHVKKGEEETAKEHFLRSFEVSKEIGYHRGVAASVIELAKFFIKNGQISNAHDYLNEVITSSFTLTPEPFKAKLLYQASRCTSVASERMTLLQQAFEITQEVDSAEIILDVCYDLGNLHELANDIERASGYYKTACESQLKNRGNRDA